MPVRTFYESLCERNMLDLLDLKGLPSSSLAFFDFFSSSNFVSILKCRRHTMRKRKMFRNFAALLSNELKNIIMKKYFQRIEYFLLLIIFLPILMKFLRLSQCLDREQHFETSHHRQQFQFSRRNSFRKVQQSSRDAIEADILF